jgi:hypothetical protein
MEPVPETEAALSSMTPDGAVRRELDEMTSAVRAIVPECVGLSLSLTAEDMTFTYVASGSSIAELDALQYLAGGPCVAAVDGDTPRLWTDGSPLEEDRWPLFALGNAVEGVRSTLSLPFLRDGRVTANVNLYASTADAFDGRVDQLAEALGAWREGAVSNADLSFSSRLRAAATPDRLVENDQVDLAVGILALEARIDAVASRDRLGDAAARSGIPIEQLARLVLQAHRRRTGE